MEKKTRVKNHGYPERSLPNFRDTERCKYSKLSTAEAPEIAKQRLTAQATHLKRYIREVETRRINRIFSNNLFRVYTQWQKGGRRATQN